jgi:hypothetical protein
MGRAAVRYARCCRSSLHAPLLQHRQQRRQAFRNCGNRCRPEPGRELTGVEREHAVTVRVGGLARRCQPHQTSAAIGGVRHELDELHRFQACEGLADCLFGDVDTPRQIRRPDAFPRQMRQQAHQRRRQEPAPRLPVDLGLRDLVQQPGAFEEERAKSLDSLDRAPLRAGPTGSASFPMVATPSSYSSHLIILVELLPFSQVTLTILVNRA